MDFVNHSSRFDNHSRRFDKYFSFISCGSMPSIVLSAQEQYHLDFSSELDEIPGEVMGVLLSEMERLGVESIDDANIALLPSIKYTIL